MRKFFRIVAALLALAIVGDAAPAGAVYGLVDQRAKSAARQPGVFLLGDSIVYGVGGTDAGYRPALYNLGQAGGVGKKFLWVGSQTGNPGTLAGIDPNHEGHPGAVITAGAAQVPPNSWISLADLETNAHAAFYPQVVVIAAGTNDMASNVLNFDASQALASMSALLDQVWAERQWSWMQIVVCQVLKRLDADDSKVQAFNAGLPALIASKSYADHITLSLMYDAIQRPVIGQGMTDDVHPANEGYADMATRMWVALQVALSNCRRGDWRTGRRRRPARRRCCDGCSRIRRTPRPLPVGELDGGGDFLEP